MKEERFRSMFAAFGTVTDCSLKFTKDGKFRKFGFVGFKAEDDANRALKHFNKSFVDTSRVTVWLQSWLHAGSLQGFCFHVWKHGCHLSQVEMCKAFGDPTKAKAWSKHTQSSGPDKPSTPADTDSKKVPTTHTHTNWQGWDVTKYFYSGTNLSLCTLREYFSVLIQHTQDFFLSEQCCEVLLHCHFLKMLHMFFLFLSSEKETDKGNQQLAWKCEYICMTCVKPK